MNLSESLKLFCLAALAGSSAAQTSDVDLVKAASSLVEAEMSYAKLGTEKGFREASLATFADDAVIFAPGMVNGKTFWQKTKEDPFIIWRPAFVSIARSGELGYTTGPSEYRSSRKVIEPEAFGDFVTIWRRDPKGIWKVVADVGVNHPQPQSPVPADVSTYVPKTGPASPESARANLEKAQRQFADALKENEADAINDNASEEIRVYRRDQIPAVGKRAAEKMLDDVDAKTSRMPTGAGTSQAVDLAYEYGEYASEQKKGTQRGIYFCIWRLDSDGNWKVILDLQKSAPPETP